MKRKNSNVKYKVTMYIDDEYYDEDIYNSYEEAEESASEWLSNLLGAYSVGKEIIDEYDYMHGDEVDEDDDEPDITYDIEEIEDE